MQIFYISNKLKKSLTNPREIIRTYGVLAKKINQRMKEFIAVENLAFLKTLPGPNCHELTGPRKGELAVDISENWRIIFEPSNEPIPSKEDGGLKWEEITEIKILEIKDYH